MRIDLHAHSQASDGTEPPAHVVRAAAEAGLDVIALTDHDTTRGWAEASAAARTTGIVLVPGMEISCEREGRSVHLLAYLFDPGYAALLAEVEHARESRVGRMDRMVERLAADGIPITIDEVRAEVTPGATIGRPHLADALVAKGVVPDRAVAFRDYLHNDSPYYVSHYAVDPTRAVELVLAAGGVPVVAHPFTRSRGRMLPEEVVLEMVEAGLAGIEVHHRDQDAAAQAMARRIADEHDLIVTGSSDYHGEGKPNRLGENTTAPAAFARMEALATGSAVVRP